MYIVHPENVFEVFTSIMFSSQLKLVSQRIHYYSLTLKDGSSLMHVNNNVNLRTTLDCVKHFSKTKYVLVILLLYFC